MFNQKKVTIKCESHLKLKTNFVNSETNYTLPRYSCRSCTSYLFPFQMEVGKVEKMLKQSKTESLQEKHYSLSSVSDISENPRIVSELPAA